MPKFLKKRFFGTHLVALFIVPLLFVFAIFIYNVLLGIIAFAGLLILSFIVIQREFLLRDELLHYVKNIEQRVDHAGETVLREVPIGMLLYDDEYRVEWANKQLSSWLPGKIQIGEPLESISETLFQLVEQSDDEETYQDEIDIDGQKFYIHVNQKERSLYFFDVTKQIELKERYEQEQVVFAIVYLDNYDEITQGMGDTERSMLNSEVTGLLNQWAVQYGIYLRRSSSDKFFAVLNKSTLYELEKTKFSLLDDIREFTSKLNVPITLSIGVGCGTSDLRMLGQLAQSSLDLALGRGGDQVAIKQANGKVRFYGGKTNPVEKRTRVRARVISHALRELILDSDKVFIMGHRQPDMDAIGSAIGILKMTQANDKEGYIIFSDNERNSAIEKLINKIKEEPSLWSRFIRPEVALDMITAKSLLVIVDTHKPSLVIEEKLIHSSERIVVIDHHRRGEDFIDEPVLVYMEPYASSTSELVTELLEYQPEHLKLSMLEATALLAGITVDTNNFTLRTGSRTFDAASYLRARGADPVLVQKFLSEDLKQYVQRSKIVERAELYRNGIAIAKGDPSKSYDQVLIAQAADTLLTISDIKAAFVISRRTDGKVSISARSHGEINVQIIMESLDGGGHLTNAATQLDEESLEAAEKKLKQEIDKYLEDQDRGDEA